MAENETELAALATRNQEDKIKSMAVVAWGASGIRIRTLEDAYRFGKLVAASQLCPPGIKTAEQVVIAIQFGAELGFSPLQALQSVAVINGRPTVFGDAMMAVCVRRGDWDGSVFSETIEGDRENMVACCTVGRRGWNPVTERFSWRDAVKGGLSERDTYKQNPASMLKRRARSRALRTVFADVLSGIPADDEPQLEQASALDAVPQPENRTEELMGRIVEQEVAQ